MQPRCFRAATTTTTTRRDRGGGRGQGQGRFPSHNHRPRFPYVGPSACLHRSAEPREKEKMLRKNGCRPHMQKKITIPKNHQTQKPKSQKYDIQKPKARFVRHMYHPIAFDLISSHPIFYHFHSYHLISSSPNHVGLSSPFISSHVT